VKKFLIILPMGLAALLVALLLLSAYGFGILTERVYRSQTNRLSRMARADFTTVKYDRGWLRSRAKTRVSLHDPLPKLLREILKDGAFSASPPSVTLSQTIDHGPFPRQNHSRLPLSLSPAAARIETLLDLTDLLRALLSEGSRFPSMALTTRIHFNSDVENFLAVPPGEILHPESGNRLLRWGPMEGFFHVENGGKGLQSGLDVSRLETGEGKEVWSLREGALRLEYPQGDSRGRATLRVGDLAGSTDSGELPLHLGKLALEASHEISNEVLSANLLLQCRNLKVFRESVEGLDFQLAARRLDFKALTTLWREGGKLLVQGFPPETLRLMMLVQFLRLAPTLLRDSPEVEIKRWDFTTPHGPFHGEARGVLKPPPGPPADLASLFSGGMRVEARCTMAPSLLEHLLALAILDQAMRSPQGEYLRSLPKTEAEQWAREVARQRIRVLEDRKVLILEGSSYSVHAVYDGRLLLVNGRPLPQEL